MVDELKLQEAGDDTYREEVERALSEDEKRLGKVWRLSREGLNPNEIAEKSGYSKAYVNHCTRMIKALVDSTLPNTTTLMARRYGPILRDFVKRHQEEYLSDATVAEIEKRADEWADEYVRRANDPAKREEEEQKLERQTSAAEKEEVPGIYVYALPHYLRYPIEASENDETDDRTYLKVGMSERDAIKRFRQQRGSTALPEPPILLRIYVGSNGMDIAEVERKIHRHLAHADHVRNSERGAGTEWFLTHLKFLDSTAELLDLKTHFVIDDSDDD